MVHFKIVYLYYLSFQIHFDKKIHDNRNGYSNSVDLESSDEKVVKVVAIFYEINELNFLILSLI